MLQRKFSIMILIFVVGFILMPEVYGCDPDTDCVAILSVPTDVNVGDTFICDGSGSYPHPLGNGEITDYGFDFQWDTGISYYETNPGDGAVDGNTTHSYDTAGTYTIKMIATVDPYERWRADKATINVHPTHVDKDATGNNDGTSWANAYTDLQVALDNTNGCDEIWVAEGTYKPDGNDPNNRALSFELADGVAIYGGFAGTEGPNERDLRDWVNNETILSGDINEPGDANDNSYSVLVGDNNAILDGFTITMGCANGDPNGDDIKARGGGMYNLNVSPTVANCKFTKNYASGMGGGMFNRNSSPTITDCNFIENVCDDDGGGMRNYEDSHAIITNCDFIGNYAYEDGGGINNRKNSNAVITNCMFINNTAGFGGGIKNHLGVWTPTGEPEIINCIFIGNKSVGTEESKGSEGGGMSNMGVHTVVTNCTFIGNLGYGMYNQKQGGQNKRDSYPDVGNCVLWDNIDGSLVNGNGGDPNVTFCDVEGGYTGTGNINADPCLVNIFDFEDKTIDTGTTTTIEVADASLYDVNDVIEYDNDGTARTVTDANTVSDIVTFDTALGSISDVNAVIYNWGIGAMDMDEDLRIDANSPCIDAANGDVAPDTDIDGNSRYDDPNTEPNTGTGDPNYVDIGAYEYQG